jgi:ABC-type antimicrobial peptide transport system permease subunit
MLADWSLDFYVPYRQYSVGNQYFLVRSKLARSEFERRAREAMSLVDPDQSVFDFAGYEERILSSIWQLRLSRLLLTLFAAVALVLAAIGIYGVMAHLVAQRHRELGIRLALGETPAGVRGLVLSQGLGLAAGGLVVGAFGAAASHLLLRKLPGVPGVDVPSIVLAGVLLGAVTALACWLPALRASRLDPAISLRGD